MLNFERNKTSHHETADNYCMVIATLSATWRVISDGSLQWIIQRRQASSKRWPWGAKSYHQDREALLIAVYRFVPYPAPGAKAVLDALPERFPRYVAPIDTHEGHIATWLLQTRLGGPIDNYGAFGLLVPLANAVDEANFADVVPGEVTAEMVKAAVKLVNIASYPSRKDVEATLQAGREGRGEAVWTESELDQLGRDFAGLSRIRSPKNGGALRRPDSRGEPLNCRQKVGVYRLRAISPPPPPLKRLSDAFAQEHRPSKTAFWANCLGLCSIEILPKDFTEDEARRDNSRCACVGTSAKIGTRRKGVRGRCRHVHVTSRSSPNQKCLAAFGPASAHNLQPCLFRFPPALI